ncbi:uncharacterized protein LOC141731897 [Zonotrichia albicollis]|uniref:uncharacterized protein LOC141731897 n=1 Tax=Zonotrichia albicollis TaxID=44394 RepID=UPI003D80C725
MSQEAAVGPRGDAGVGAEPCGSCRGRGGPAWRGRAALSPGDHTSQRAAGASMRPAGPACAAPAGHGGGRLPAGPGARIAAWRRHRRPPSASGTRTGTDPAAAAPRRPHPTRKWAVTGSPGCRRERRPRASASGRARPRRPGLSRPVPSRSALSRDVASRDVPSRSPRSAPRCGTRGSGGSARWRRRARHAGDGSSPWPAEGGPCGGGDYKSRHTARLRPTGGAVPRGPGRGRPSDRPGPEAAPGQRTGPGGSVSSSP